METKVIDYLNFEKEHLCCVLRDRNGEGRIAAKREWLKNVFEDGLVIRKGAENGKIMMEYVPADDAWCPVEAPEYMFIHCFRVEEKYKDKGYEKALWRECIAECRIKHKKGLCVLVGERDLPYLNKKADFLDQGFQLAQKAAPYFELWYYPLAEDAVVPRFLPEMTAGEVENDGFVLYYSHQCPHTAKAVPLLQKKATELGIDLKVIYLTKQKEARAIPCAYTTFALFCDKQFVTHEVLTPAQFAKTVEKLKK
jgi:hypothetical protein